MNALAERICALIAAQGPLPVAQYMTLALHDPRGGYYATRDPFGEHGDFVTAPEISQTFGELLGLWCTQAWQDQGCPKGARLVELGPGRGTLMTDALRAAKLVPEFNRGLEILLVEASPALQEIQKKNLKDARVRWTAHFEQSEQPLFLLANEFFDALAIHQYIKTPRGWCERMVTAANGGLEFALAPIPVVPASVAPTHENAPEGAFYETSPASIALVEEIASAIARRGGAALIVDYGHESGAGFGETLQAVKGHKFAGLLADPGESDLCAHVDFGALAQAARRAGAAVFGPKPQGEFLAELGIDARARQLGDANPGEAEAIANGIARLTSPDQMGRLFKALAILPKSAPPPPGF